MRDEEEQEYAFQYWFERGYPVKRIHSRLPAFDPENHMLDRAVKEELFDILAHKQVESKQDSLG